MIDDRLKALAAIADQAGIFCDFDGTLSEIVDDHDAARAVEGATDALAMLAGRFAVVAVVSGRQLDDLATRVRAPGVRLLGSYGLEEDKDGVRWTHPEAEAQRDAVARAADAVEMKLPAGVRVERKGLAAAIHFRPAEDPSSAQREVEPIVRRIADAERLDVIPGRLVLEMRVSVPVDKGGAVRRLIEENSLRGALVIGDDEGDLAMFDAVDACEVAVRVGVRSAEMPPDLDARADLHVDGPRDVVALLTALASS